MVRGGRRVLLTAIGVLAVLASRVRADEWNPAKPKSAPTGVPLALKRALGDPTRLPRARVLTTQVHSWADRKRDLALEFDATCKPEKADEKGRARVEVAVEVTALVVEDEDLIRGKGTIVPVLTSFDARGFAAEGTPKGPLAEGKVGEALKPVGAWVLPYLPEKPVRVGEAWDLPIPYFLWSVNQLGGVPAEGFATQVLEAVEDHEGVRCARVKTTVAIKRPQPKGWTPPAVGVGDGPALARFHAEGTTWVDLQGVLREDRLDLKMRVENTESKAWMEWAFHREVKAQPAGEAPKPKDWSAHVGKVEFVIGYEKGMDEAWEAGKPAMLFFTSEKDHWCPIFAARTWKDEQVLDKVKDYVPVLVDADADPVLAKRYMALILPAVVWVDSEGDAIYSMIGDAPLDLFRIQADVAFQRKPDVGPSESLTASRKAAEALRAARRAGDTKATLRAIQDVRAVNRPKALVQEAKAAEEEIDRRGADDLAKAKALVDAGRKDEAKEALRKIKQSYGDHPAGQSAWSLLRKIEDEGK